MRKTLITLSAGLALLGPGLTSAQTALPPGPGQTALSAAARDGKYLFVLFFKEDSPATQAMRRTLSTTLAQRGGRAASVSVQITNPAEKALVDRFGVGRSPMPLAVALAPNGAITGGFPLKLTDKDVAGAFVSPGQAACLKAVQSRKLVLLCVLPAGAPGTLPEGVRAFQADTRYGPATEVVAVRANDSAEADFLKALRVSPATVIPVTALLAPPGRLLGSFPGPVTRQQLVDRVSAPQGCCPGGKCCPGGCCGPNR